MDGVEEGCWGLLVVGWDGAAGVKAAWFRFGRLEDDLEEVVGEAEAEDLGEVGGGVGEGFIVRFLFDKGFWRSVCQLILYSPAGLVVHE